MSVFSFSKEHQNVTALRNAAADLNANFSGTTTSGELHLQRQLPIRVALSCPPKSPPRKLQFIIDKPDIPELTLRGTNSTDRFGRRIGLNRTIETGDEIFDKVVYVETNVSDETALKATSSERFRRNIIFLAQAGYEVKFEQNTISIETTIDSPDELSSKKLDEIITVLEAAVCKVPQFSAYELQAPEWTAAKVFSIAAPLSFFVGFGLLMLGRFLWPPVDYSGAWFAAQLGIILWLPICLIIGFLVRGRPDSMRAFLFCFFMLPIGLPLNFAGAGLVLNGLCDTSPQVAHKTVVLSTRTSRSRRSTSYYITVPSWQTNTPGASTELRVSYSTFASLANGSPVNIVTCSGLFGWEWVVSPK